MFSIVAALWLGTASAQETVDIGVIKESDVRVVQKLLYPKTGRTEMGLNVGYMPFDAYTKAPNAQLTFDMHRSETFSIGLAVGGGYGFRSQVYNELESPTYGVAVDAYRYLASALVGASLAPVYGKVNTGSTILHYDVYGAARVGATLESSLIPEGGMAVAPTISPALGTRFFVGDNGAIRLEIRDDFLLEHRKLTDSTHIKQNVNITIGYSILSKLDGSGR